MKRLVLSVVLLIGCSRRVANPSGTAVLADPSEAGDERTVLIYVSNTQPWFTYPNCAAAIDWKNGPTDTFFPVIRVNKDSIVIRAPKYFAEAILAANELTVNPMAAEPACGYLAPTHGGM